MELYDITSLKKTTISGSNYDLFEVRYERPDTPDGDIGMLPYVVKRGEDMRMDLISISIYGTTEYVDFLCFINNISNPLNVKARDTIIYVIPGNIDSFKVKVKSDDVIQAVAKSNRATKPDASREEYLSNNLSLPPNILQKPVEQIIVAGDLIKLGNGTS
jgi:hypothetical protein